MRYYTKNSGAGFERSFTFEHDGDEILAYPDDGGPPKRCRCVTIGDGSVMSLVVDGASYDCLVDFEARTKASVQVLGEVVNFEVEDDRERAAKQVSGAKAGGKRIVEAAMPGVVVAVEVAEGDAVTDGQTLVVLDAMKMQNPIGAEGDGVVVKLHVAKGDTVAAGAKLAELESEG